MTIVSVFLAPRETEPDFFQMTEMQAYQIFSRENKYRKIGTLFSEKTGEAAAEDMFDLSNNPDREDERAERWGSYRSLSVGDAVSVDGQLYLCASVGWRKVPLIGQAMN